MLLFKKTLVKAINLDLATAELIKRGLANKLNRKDVPLI